jgi:hypothetical protein
MTESEASIVFHAPEGRRKGGRLKKYNAVAIAPSADFPDIRLPAKTKPALIPDVVKLAQMHEHLRVSRATVYRMQKEGLKTFRYRENGDQHVRREDLDEFLRGREAPKRKR